MKIKLDIFVTAKNKAGDVVLTRKNQTRIHQCDILITHQHDRNSFVVDKNRNTEATSLKNGTVSFNRVLSLGSTMPRKKKKAFKKRIQSI